MSLILKEQYGKLTIEVNSTGLLNPTYRVLFYVENDGSKDLVWDEGFNESVSPYPRGVELALTGFILRSKTGIWVTDQPDPSDYERMRVITNDITKTPEFAIRFSNCKMVSEAVFHHGHTFTSSGTMSVIDKPVHVSISCTIPGDGLSDYPTYQVTCTAASSDKLLLRAGYRPTIMNRACTFNIKRDQLRFDDEEFIREYKEELIIALGLEGTLS